MSFKSRGGLHACGLTPLFWACVTICKITSKHSSKKYLSYNLTNSSTTPSIHFDSDAFGLRVFSDAEHKIN